ncbi:unnamed protein product [Peronospora effusa]|nr:unnamed protein product [Peronospora effusa]
MVGSMDLIRDQDRMLTAFSGRTETSSVCWAGNFNQDVAHRVVFPRLLVTLFLMLSVCIGVDDGRSKICADHFYDAVVFHLSLLLRSYVTPNVLLYCLRRLLNYHHRHLH